MSNIDIEGLSLEEVIQALFENVYDKSEASKQMKHLIGPSEEKPTKDSISRFLKNEINWDGTVQLDYLSSVHFNININKSILLAQKYLTNLIITPASNKKTSQVLDMSFYDKIHKTETTQGIMTAEACINALKIKAGIIDPGLIRWQKTLMNLKSQDYSNRTEPCQPRNYCVKEEMVINGVNQTLSPIKNTALLTESRE